MRGEASLEGKQGETLGVRTQVQQLESWENSECLCESSKETRQEPWELLQTQTCSWKCIFVFLPGVVDRSVFTSAVVIHLPLWKTSFAM